MKKPPSVLLGNGGIATTTESVQNNTPSGLKGEQQQQLLTDKNLLLQGTGGTDPVLAAAYSAYKLLVLDQSLPAVELPRTSPLDNEAAVFFVMFFKISITHNFLSQ